MDHVSTWLQSALLPDRWDVCGVPCSALSVWHVFALSEVGNPYLCGGPIDRDAATALLVYCCGDYRHGKRLFTGPYYRRKVTRRITRRLRSIAWPTIDTAIRDYVDTCCRVPAHKKPEGDPKKGIAVRAASAPIGWVLVERLSDGNPDKVAQAWDVSYAQACCMFDAGRDVRGEIDTLESRDDEIRIDAYLEKEKGGQ